jgi:AraC-like DNA-binding protein
VEQATPDGRSVTWQAAVSRAFAPLQVRPHGHGAVTGRLSAVDLDGVHIAALEADAQVVRRLQSLTGTAAGGWLTLGLQLSGSVVLRQDEVEAHLRPGELTVYDADRPFQLLFPTSFRSVAVQVPKRRLSALGVDLTCHGPLAVPEVSGTASILAPVLRALAAPRGAAVVPTSGHRLAASLLGMLAALLEEHAPASSAQNVLRLRIADHVRTHLPEPDLTPQRIARDLHVSVRALHRAFEAHQDSLAATIRRQRLEACRKDLLNGTLPVSSVGRRWGFDDPAHFSRAFKAEYGLPPGSYRERALAP